MTTPQTLIPRPYRSAPDNAPDGVRVGQWVAEVEADEIVVFVIGMEVHRWRKVRSWVPVARAMFRMLDELESDPGSGFLGTVRSRQGRKFLQVQYWRSAEELGRYAHDAAREHAPAWAAFNRRGAGTGDVGLFHETYRVPREGVESLYANMRDHGLLAVLGARPRHAVRRTRTHEQMQSVEAEYVEL
jgi:hypothetical protein